MPPRFRPALETLEGREVPAGLGRFVDDLGVVAQASGHQAGAYTVPPTVALDGNGSRFVMAWTDVAPVGGVDKVTVYARVLAADGSPLTDVITVTDSPLPFSPSRPVKVDVAVDAEGRFAVAYDGLPNGGAGLADLGLRRFNADGTPFGATFVVGTSSRLDINPSIDLADDGRIAVSYDQATSNLATNRLNYTLFASFQNLSSSTSVSISSVGGEIYTDMGFNASGHFLLGGTTLSSQASTSFRIAGSSGTLSASTALTSPVLAPPAVAGVPDGDGWRVAYLDSDNGVTRLVMREVTAGANLNVAPVLGPPVVLAAGVSAALPPALAVDSAGNLAVAYGVPDGAGVRLVVGFFDAAGQPLQTLSLDASTPLRHAIARGATAFDALAAFTGPAGQAIAGSAAVPFGIHAALFPAPTARPGPAAPPAASGFDPLAFALEQAARTVPPGLAATQTTEAPQDAELADMMFGPILGARYFWGHGSMPASGEAGSPEAAPSEEVFTEVHLAEAE